MDKVDVLVVGAGVVGLAVARALAKAGHEVVIAEAAAAFGTGVSSRNSEVVHAGVYYPPGSLKARLCLRGKELLYAYAQQRGIAHRQCGKLLVATRAEDEAKLAALQANARACGLTGLTWLTREQARALEPELDCAVALLSPSSGIVDSHGLMTAMLADAQAAGALLALASPVTGAQRRGDDWAVHSGGFSMAATWIVNAAGLAAQHVAASMEGFAPAAIPRRHLARGHYFTLPGRAPFSRLIYPTPVDGGLGVHHTIDLGGQAKFGPDVEWLPDAPPAGDAELDYTVDTRRATGFEAEVRRYWPRLPAGALQAAYCGIRPKITGPGEPAGDFRIDGPAQHGCAGVVQLFGIESPGLTAAMAIGEHVAELLRGG
jgi:L-2-hydroxyglutarate oxidase LhgO